MEACTAERKQKAQMQIKGFSASDIDFELDFLEKEGLQSDKRFAECYARFRGAKGFGPHRIKRELIQKKVNKDVIDEVMLSMEEMFEGFHKEFILKNRELDPSVLKGKLFQRGFKSDLLDGCEEWN